MQASSRQKPQRRLCSQAAGCLVAVITPFTKDALEGHRGGYGECFYLYEEIHHLEFMLEALWSLGNMQE